MSQSPSPIGTGFVFACDGCGDLHLFALDQIEPVALLASWGWRMGGWDLDLCPTCVADEVEIERGDDDGL